MTDKNTYWLRDTITGEYALVVGADERDRWVGQGYADADEPTEGFVHVWHEGIELPGSLPVPALNQVFSHSGWVAGPPPGGVRPVSAPFGEVTDTAATPSATAVKSTSRSAAGGKEKE